MLWKKFRGHVASPAGFCGSATHAGIKKSGALDLALIYCEGAEATAAGIFTTNRSAAAPVLLSRRHLVRSGGRARAIVVNSGNANACTGKAGMQIAEESAGVAAELLGIPRQQVLVASTGVIGKLMNPSQITHQLPALVASLSGANAHPVARAIMTTDAFPKVCALRGEMEGRRVHLVGIAKGAGMIHPRMATMLSFITTDVAVPAPDLKMMLSAAASDSFNRISVDGDRSTNDTVIVLSSGLSGIAACSGTLNGKALEAGLLEVCQSLARMIVKDGEGATKLVRIEVTGAKTQADADRASRAIANSPLVKTALSGGDPNWGRIVCAVGYSGARFDPRKVDVRVNSLFLCRNGIHSGFDETAAQKQFSKREFTLQVDLHQGKAAAHMWTCDFTGEYVRINASRS
ncbi:MAG: bifunctional glutamate N-acetyltransferase/amino-acid acetyltransferase ArgJ [Terriglobia bacterium]